MTRRAATPASEKDIKKQRDSCSIVTLLFFSSMASDHGLPKGGRPLSYMMPPKPEEASYSKVETSVFGALPS